MIRLRHWHGALFAAILLPCLLKADLASVKSESNLERRSERALDNASLAIDAAREASQKGSASQFETALQELQDSVELSFNSLQQTGKAARSSPKYFKRAELKTRALLKRLDTLESEIPYDERAKLAGVKKRLHEINDQLVLDIMTKKKK